jgi:uncharacterized membrane protein
MATIVGAMVTFTGMVFSILLVAVQFASAQLTPRVLKTSLSDLTTKFSLGMFIFTFVYAAVVMSRIADDFVPQLAVFLGLIFVSISLILFFFLINHVGYSLRAVNIVTRIGAGGKNVIDRMYPRPYSDQRVVAQGADEGPNGSPTRTLVHTGSPGVVLAIDIDGLVAMARRHNAVIVFAPAVGDFVPTGAPLFYLFESGQPMNDKELQNSVALGPERTLQQDPAFAFRILVDIGAKALSPGVNDPTSAVIAIDQIHNLLFRIGTRQLDVGQYRDNSGRLRLEMQTPTWEDFVSLAVDEIRLFGRDSVQVVRRLRAMLEDLLDMVPEERKPPLQQQLELIERAVPRSFADPEDRERASIGDYQGVGSSRETGYRRPPSRLSQATSATNTEKKD